MYIYVDETLQLGLDCVASLSPREAIAFGWVMTPRGEETGLSVLGEQGQDCALEHSSFHPRPDVLSKQPGRAVVNGFCLVVATPPGTGDLTLTVWAGAQLLRAPMQGPELRTDLPRVTAERDWRTTFALLASTAEDPALAPLLAYRDRPFGAFGEWVSRLATLRGRAADFAGFAEVEALATPAGEILVMLRAAGHVATEAEAEGVLIGWPKGDEDATGIPLVLPLADRHVARLPGALAIYGRVEAAWVEALASLEFVLEARLRGEERVWIRAIPVTVPAADLLDAVCRGVGGTAPRPGKEEAAALELLRRLIARREAAFAPAVAALSATSIDAGARAGEARIALVTGADDPAAARLFEVNAAELERRCDRLLVLGDAADTVAAAIARRGRIEAAAGEEAMRALREAAGRNPVLALDALRFAEAIAEGRPEDAFPRRLASREVTRLLALHAMAGSGRSLADSLARVLGQRRGVLGEGRFAPIGGGWSSRGAAALVSGHLARLWAGAALPDTAEQPIHG